MPRGGFVSLGCPKATVDSERILTQLRAEGYAISPTYDGADLVLVNTCGFIDAAVEESLEAIGEALSENGRVIVTGCLGARADLVRDAHPEVLAVTGPHAYQEGMEAVHRHLRSGILTSSSNFWTRPSWNAWAPSPTRRLQAQRPTRCRERSREES
jgi:ribosomal protein S12 methylthiotransferase